MSDEVVWLKGYIHTYNGVQIKGEGIYYMMVMTLLYAFDEISLIIIA